MRRLRFWVNLTVLVVPIGIIGMGTSHLVRNIWDYLNSDARLAGLLSTEATRALGREVIVRDIKFRASPWSLLPNRVELSGISIAQYPTLNSALFAHADKVVVWYDLNQILFAKDPTTPLVKELQVIGPQLFLSRDAQGKWNFDQIFKPTKTSGRPFTDKISFSRASLVFSDLSFPHPTGVPRRPFTTRIDQAAGVVLVRPDKSVAFDVQGKPDPNLLRDFHVTGIAGLNATRIDVRLIAHRVNLPAFAARFVPSTRGRLLSGSADLDVSALYAPPVGTPLSAVDLNAIDAHGIVNARGISLTAPQLEGPLQNVNLNGTFTTDSFTGGASAQYAGMAVSVQGQVIGLLKRETLPSGKTRIALALPIVALEGQAPQVDIARLLRVLHLDKRLTQFPALAPNVREQIVRTTGQVSNLKFQVAGSLDNPTLTAAAHVTQARSFGYSSETADVRALLDNKIVTADVRGKLEGGDFAARSRVLTQEPGTFDVEAHGRNVQLAALNSLLKRKISGRGNLDLAMRGRRHFTPFISAQAQAFDIKLNNQSINSVFAMAATVGQNLVIKTIRLDDPKGFALASGTIDLKTQQLKLNVAADNLDLNALFKAAQTTQGRGDREQNTLLPNAQHQASTGSPEGQTPNTLASASPLFDVNKLQGQGFFRGRVEGTVQNPELSGRVSAFSVQAGKAGLERVLVDFSVSREALVIAKGTAERYPGKLTFSGRATDLLNGEPAIQVQASAQNIDIPDLLQLTGMQGSATERHNGTGEIRPLDDYLIRGTISMAPIEVTGRLKKGSALLENLRLTHPVTVTGNRIFINGLPIETPTAIIGLDGNNVHLTSLHADVAGGTLTATGSLTDLLNRADGSTDRALLDLDIKADNLDAGRLTDALPTKLMQWDATGTLNLEAKVTGPLNNPAISATTDTRSLVISDDMGRSVDVGNVRAQARYVDKRVLIDTASINEAGIPLGTANQIEFEGFVYDPQNKALNGVIHWNGLRFQHLRELFEKSPFAQPDTIKQIGEGLKTNLKQAATAFQSLSRPLGGSISGQARIGGTTDAPTVDVTFNAADIRIEDRAITSITGSAFVDKNSLRIPSPSSPDQMVRLRSQDLDIDVINVNAVFQGALSADVRANRLNLAALKQLFPPEAAKDPERAGLVQKVNALSGTGTAEVLVSGTIAAPVVDASLNLRDVKYSDPKLGEQSINRIDIAHLTASEGSLVTDSIQVLLNKIDPDTKQVTAKLEANAHGSIDFSWKPPFITRDANIDFTADVPTQNLSALAVFGRNLNITSDGTFSLHAHASNTLAQYRLFGSLTLDANKLQFGHVGVGKEKSTLFRTGLRDLSGKIDFLNDRIAIHDGFTAHTQVFPPDAKGDPKKNAPPKSAPGKAAASNEEETLVHLTGSLPLEGNSAEGIRLVVNKASFNENLNPSSRNDDIKGEAGINVHLFGSAHDPTIGGLVTFANTTVSNPPTGFGGSPGGPLAFPFNPKFDSLIVRLDDNVRIQNPELDAHIKGLVSINGPLLEDAPFGTAPAPTDSVAAVLSDDPSDRKVPQRLGLNVLGKLNIIDGKLTLPTAHFTVLTPSQLTLTYPIPDPGGLGAQTLGVDVDLKARTNLTATSISGIRKRYTVTVAARGPITGAVIDPITGESRLVLNFTTDPNDLATNQQGLQQRLAGVLGGDALGQFGRNPGQVVAQQLTNVFTSAVIPNLFDRTAAALGFEELSVNYDPVQRLNLTISRHLFGPLYVTYIRTLSTTPETYNLKLSLRFKDKYQFSYDIDEQHTSRYLLESVFHF